MLIRSGHRSNKARSSSEAFVNSFCPIFEDKKSKGEKKSDEKLANQKWLKKDHMTIIIAVTIV